MTYKANVWQNTGVDWNKVNLTLSTGNPSKGATPPNVDTWRLDFDQPGKAMYGYDGYGAPPPAEPEAAEEEVLLESVVIRGDKSKERDRKREEYRNRQSSAQHTSMNSDRVNTEWTIDIPYTIPMTGKPQSVEISQIELNAHYAHFAAPKMDIDAFLLAHVTDWEQYNLLPGQASIYFEGAYTGKAYIETRTTKDTLDLSMGRDQSITINREKIKDFSKIQTIGSNKKVSNGIEITIRNTKDEKVSMKIADQVPRSRNKEVEVSLEESDGGELNKETGELTWEFDLEPGATKTIRFIFEVKYPKDWTIANL